MVGLHLNKEDMDKQLVRFANLIKRRLRADWDIVIAISGEEGSGKSICGMIVSWLIDNRWDMEKNVSFLPDEKEIKTEFRRLKQHQCYVIDEAIKSLYKMNFMNSLQQSLVQMWATERYQNKATILILPRFKDLTENFRNHRVKIWINVLARGVACVYSRDEDPHLYDPWHFDESERYKRKKYGHKNVSTIPIDMRLATERKLKNFLFDFRFPDLPPEDKARYQELKLESRRVCLDQERENEKKKEGKITQQLRDGRNWMIRYVVDELAGDGKKEETKELLCEKLFLSKQTMGKILKLERKKEMERNEKEETDASYTGVDRFLKSAIEREKAKHQSNVQTQKVMANKFSYLNKV